MVFKINDLVKLKSMVSVKSYRPLYGRVIDIKEDKIQVKWSYTFGKSGERITFVDYENIYKSPIII